MGRGRNSSAIIYITCNDSDSQLFQVSFKTNLYFRDDTGLFPELLQCMTTQILFRASAKKNAAYFQAEKHLDPHSSKQRHLEPLLKSLVPDVHKNRSIARVKAQTTPSRNRKPIGSQQSSGLSPAGKTSPCSTSTTRPLKNATRVTNLYEVSVSQCKMN